MLGNAILAYAPLARRVSIATSPPEAVYTAWCTLVPRQARGPVVLADELGSMPCVRAPNGELVPLFHVFAVMEENLDFVEVCRELPGVSPADVSAAFDFMYQALQANTARLDIEPLIERYGHGSRLLEEVRQHMARSTVSRGYVKRLSKAADYVGFSFVTATSAGTPMVAALPVR